MDRRMRRWSFLCPHNIKWTYESDDNDPDMHDPKCKTGGPSTLPLGHQWSRQWSYGVISADHQAHIRTPVLVMGATESLRLFNNNAEIFCINQDQRVCFNLKPS